MGWKIDRTKSKFDATRKLKNKNNITSPRARSRHLGLLGVST